MAKAGGMQGGAQMGMGGTGAKPPAPMRPTAGGLSGQAPMGAKPPAPNVMRPAMPPAGRPMGPQAPMGAKPPAPQMGMPVRTPPPGGLMAGAKPPAPQYGGGMFGHPGAAPIMGALNGMRGGPVAPPVMPRGGPPDPAGMSGIMRRKPGAPVQGLTGAQKPPAPRMAQQMQALAGPGAKGPAPKANTQGRQRLAQMMGGPMRGLF